MFERAVAARVKLQGVFVMSTEPAPQEASPAPAPRVQLNPTVAPEQARPVPSFYSPPAGPPPADSEKPEPTAVAVAEPEPDPSATAVAPREKVEIPSQGAALDAEL